jgi:hypothetical protein
MTRATAIKCHWLQKAKGLEHSLHVVLNDQATDRRPDADVMTPSSVEKPGAQAEAESGAAVRVERLLRPHFFNRSAIQSGSRLKSTTIIRIFCSIGSPLISFVVMMKPYLP